MSERVLELIYKIEGLDKSIKDLEKLVRSQKKMKKETKQSSSAVGSLAKSLLGLSGSFDKANSFAGRMRITTGGLRRRIGALRNEILVFVFALGGLVAALKSSVQAATQVRNSLLGLGAVARKTVGDSDAAKEAAIALTNDGLMSIRGAAEGLKNLLSTGFSLPEAVNLMNAFRDSAAFGRQGALSFEQAIIGATQGIKNQNCLDSKTLVYDPVRGETKTIEEWHDSKVVPCVLSLNRDTNKLETIQADYLHYNGENEIFEIELINGKTIKATSNHRFLTQDGFKFLEDLDINKDVIYYVDEDLVDNTLLTENVKSILIEDEEIQNVVLDNEFSIDYIDHNQFCDNSIEREEKCKKPAKLVGELYQSSNKSSVPMNVVRFGTKNTSTIYNKENVLTAKTSMLGTEIQDSVLQNVYQDIRSEKQKNGQRNVEIAKSSSHPKNQRLYSVATNVQQNITKKYIQRQLGQKNACAVKKNFMLSGRRDSIQRNSVLTDVDGTTNLIIKRKSTKNVNDVVNCTTLQGRKTEKDLGFVQDCVPIDQQWKIEERIRDQILKFQKESKLNVKSAEEILCLLNTWSKKDLDCFVQKNVDLNLLKDSSVEKIALIMLNELKKYVKNATLNTCLPQGKIERNQDFAQKDARIEPIVRKCQGRGTQIISMVDLQLSEELDLPKSSLNYEDRFLKGIPFDAYDAIELLKVILMHITFLEDLNAQKSISTWITCSPFVKSATKKSIDWLNSVLRKELNIIPTPIKIKKIISQGIASTYDLSVPEHFNYIAQGFATHNSIMVDNVGITKNLSNILREAGFSMQDLSKVTSDANVRMALYKGLLKEAAIFQGNASLLAGEFSGKQSQLSTAIFKTKAALGETLIPAVEDFIVSTTGATRGLEQLLIANKNLIAANIKQFYNDMADAMSRFADLVSKVFRIVTFETVKFSNAFDVLRNIIIFFISKRIIIVLINLISGLGTAFTGAAVVGRGLSAVLTGLLSLIAPLRLGLIALSVVATYLISRYAKQRDTLEEARKAEIKKIASMRDNVSQSIRFRQEINRSIGQQISNIEQTIEQSGATQELIGKLKDLQDELRRSGEAMRKMQIRELQLEFKQIAKETFRLFKIMGEGVTDIPLGIEDTLLDMVILSNKIESLTADKARTIRDALISLESMMKKNSLQTNKASTTMLKFANILSKLAELMDPVSEKLTQFAGSMGGSSKAVDQMVNKLEKAQQKLEDIIVRTTSTAEAFELFKFGRMIAEMGELVEVAEKLKIPQERIDEFLQILNKAGALGREEILNKFAEKREKAAKREREAFERENQKMIKAYQRDFDEVIDIQNEAGLRRAELEGKIGRDIIFENSQTLVRLQEIMEQRPELAKRISEIIKLIHKNEAEEIKRIHEEQIQSQIDSIDQFVGGLFNLGETIANIFGGIRRDFKGDMDQLTRDFKRGVIDQAEFARRMAIIQKNISTEIANSWKDLGRTLLQSFSQVLQQMLIKIAAAKAASQGLEAGLTSLAGLGAIGIPVAAGLLAATLLAPNRPESFGAQTPEGDLGGEGGRRRFGGIAQAPTINLSLTPTVSIIGETIYISGGTIEELETGLEDLIVETTRKAIDTGELTFDPLFETGG